MTEAEIYALRRDLAALTERPWRFVYCPAGTDGFPVLLLARKRLPADAITTLMRWGRSRTLIRGTVARRDGVLVFAADRPDRVWFTGLCDFFSALIPELAEAQAVQLRS